MSRADLIDRIIRLNPRSLSPGVKLLGPAAVAVAVGGAVAGGWAALLTATSLVIGLAAAGVAFSAILQITGARWGRAYQRICEGSIAFAPVGLAGIAALLIGAGSYLPWAHQHHLTGGKAIWLTRGFWDLRVLAALALSYGISLVYIYHSLRKDFCHKSVSEAFRGPLASFLGRNIEDREKEALRCDARMTFLSPILLIAYAFCFTLLGFDLIMALEPDWYSTLFGAWYAMGHLFGWLALLSLIGIYLRARLGLQAFLGQERQRVLASLLLAFCLLNIDFLWSQYLTIWYANLPEETGYLVERIHDQALPWHYLAWAALSGFFFIPAAALLFRRLKLSNLLLGAVAVTVISGLFLARFLEIAPALITVEAPAGLLAVARPLLASVMVYTGMLAAGFAGLQWLFTRVPILPVGDEIFLTEYQQHTEDE